MIYAYCVDKKVENGNITEYKLIDFEGNTQILKSGVLKSMISDGSICVVNLTLTSDKKLRTHSIPTLNDLLRPYNGEETQINLNQMLNDNRALLGDIDSKNCFLYKHKLFFIKSSLNVLNTSTKEIITVDKNNRGIYVENAVFIPNGQYLSIIAETHSVNMDYISYGLCLIVYDIYTDNYYITRLCNEDMNQRKDFIDTHYEMGVNDIISLKDKSNNVLPYFILHNKSKSVCYYIKGSSKEMMIEFFNKIKHFERYGLKFNVNVFLEGVELELDNYIIKIDKKTKSGTLLRMR